jgi:hypothetical protein
MPVAPNHHHHHHGSLCSSSATAPTEMLPVPAAAASQPSAAAASATEMASAAAAFAFDQAFSGANYASSVPPPPPPPLRLCRKRPHTPVSALGRPSSRQEVAAAAFYGPTVSAGGTGAPQIAIPDSRILLTRPRSRYSMSVRTRID